MSLQDLTQLPNIRPKLRNVKPEACVLGIISDSDLSLDAQRTEVVQSCFIQLRHITY